MAEKERRRNGHDVQFIEIARGVRLAKSAWTSSAEQVLNPAALKLLSELHRNFEPSRQELLAARAERQTLYDRGAVPEYLDKKSTAANGEWRVAPIPSDLLCRRVEITGPVNSAKMVINMLSRGEDGVRADCAMLDFEDSCKPSWENVIAGVHNVIRAARGTLTHHEPAKNGKPDKIYSLKTDDLPVIMVRCRGLHLNESNLLIGGLAISAGLFDLALCFLHTAKDLLAQGKTPKYYVPKCEHFLEARWWSGVFAALEDSLGLNRSSLRATFLIETLPAAFQIEEILYEIRAHAAGLNVGRWDKIFSDIKTLKFHKDRVLADRAFIDMNKPWMQNYALRLIEICHRRGAFAMGGMSAFTPGQAKELREQQLAKVKADKAQEAAMGHDGCWVSHPFFIAPAMAEFKENNQLQHLPPLADNYPDLLPQAIGPKTEAGLRKNVRVGIAYLYGWINDIGCVAWDNLMEDLATLEISRAQVWQWQHHGIELENGQKVSGDFVRTIFAEEFDRILSEVNPPARDQERWTLACSRAVELFVQEDFQDFLCLTSEVAPISQT